MLTTDNAGNITQFGGQLFFPATQSASSGANVLDDYEEGTWTPTDDSGASLSLTITSAIYTKIGRMVMASFDITYPATASGATMLLGGLPFNIGSPLSAITIGYNGSATALIGGVFAGGAQFQFYKQPAAVPTNANLSGSRFIGVGLYNV